LSAEEAFDKRIMDLRGVELPPVLARDFVEIVVQSTSTTLGRKANNPGIGPNAARHSFATFGLLAYRYVDCRVAKMLHDKGDHDEALAIVASLNAGARHGMAIVITSRRNS
jgi:hypothetical protein